MGNRHRRADVLRDILEANPGAGELEKRADGVKKLLTGYKTMTGALRGELMKLGFAIKGDGKHYRLTYRGDARYSTTLPKTGSDNRGGINSAQEIIREIY